MTQKFSLTQTCRQWRIHGGEAGHCAIRWIAKLVTRHNSFKPHQNQQRLGLCFARTDPTDGAHSAPQDPLAGGEGGWLPLPMNPNLRFGPSGLKIWPFGGPRCTPRPSPQPKPLDLPLPVR